jgi:hypothetical protein
MLFSQMGRNNNNNKIDPLAPIWKSLIRQTRPGPHYNNYGTHARSLKLTLVIIEHRQKKDQSTEGSQKAK